MHLLSNTKKRKTIWILTILFSGFLIIGGCAGPGEKKLPKGSRSDLFASNLGLGLRFFETAGTGKPLNDRVYEKIYRHDKTRRIAWELNLRSSPLSTNSTVALKAIWLFNETELLHVQTAFLKLQKHRTEFHVSASWKPWTNVGWIPGRYTVALWAGKNKLISNDFSISSSESYRSAKPLKSPLLRLNASNHHACLNEFETDKANKYLVTASNDKTVRLWDLNRYRLLRVLRPPIGDGEEGLLRTVAISPNGALIACGGQTGKNWNMSYVVYVFDRAKGKLIRTLKGFPNPIRDIIFSEDETSLIVCYMDGFRVYTYPELGLVDQVKISSRWITRADLSLKNELALATSDGHISIYALNDAYIIHKTMGKTYSGKKPISVKYSPDGKDLVVTFRDCKDIDVYSAKNMQYRFSPISAGLGRFLTSAVWSANGMSIYAGGTHREYKVTGGARDEVFPIFEWYQKGKGKRISIPIGNIGINTLHTLNDGRIIYGLYDGTWGILDIKHNKVFAEAPSILHFRNLRKRCRISPDASKVYFQYDLHQDSGFVIDILLGQVIPWHEISGQEQMIYPRVHHPELDITRWKKKRLPRLNGRPLFDHKKEISRCLAIEANGDQFIIGTNRNIYAFKNNGEKLWRTLVPSVTRAVNISASGDIVVAHVGDGTIRWYRMKDGKEFLAFFAHPDRKRWIAWTPEGYYMCAPHGDNLIGWHLNNDKDQAADFYTALSFERLLYMPHYVKTSFKRLGDRESMVRENKNLGFAINKLGTILPPRVTIMHPEPGFVSHSESVRLQFNVQRTGIPLKNYIIYLNNIPLTPAPERMIDSACDRFDHEIAVALHQEENTIRIESNNGRSMGIAETHFYAKNYQPPEKGDLYLLSIGINKFWHMPSRKLSFAVNDAEKLAARFKAEEGKAFRRVHIRTITDHSRLKPMKKTIIQQLDFFKSARLYDTSILFLASHGLSDNSGNYYLVPCDGSFGDISRIIDSQNRGLKTIGYVVDSSLISWRAFFDTFRSIPGKRLLIVDTCHSQAISGTLNVYSLAKRSASSAFAFMTSSKDSEASQELPAIKHGLFTYALLRGLSGEGNRDGDHLILLSELYRYTLEYVTRHHNRFIGSQTPQMESPDELLRMAVGFDDD